MLVAESEHLAQSLHMTLKHSVRVTVLRSWHSFTDKK